MYNIYIYIYIYLYINIYIYIYIYIYKYKETCFVLPRTHQCSLGQRAEKQLHSISNYILTPLHRFLSISIYQSMKFINPYRVDY